VKERRTDFIAPIFAKRNFDDISESVSIQDCADGVSHIEHQEPQAAVNFIRA
jgi:hypothetical protein